MKPKTTLRHFLALAGSSLLAISSASAQSTLYFDGGTTDIAGNGNGSSAGGAGTWNTTTKNWDAGAVPYVAWNNANGDNAVIAGSGTLTVDVPVTVGALTLSYTSGTRTINGSEITINSGLSLGSLAGLTWNAPIKLGGDQIWSHGGNNTTAKRILGGTNLNGHQLTYNSSNTPTNGSLLNHGSITGTGDIVKDGTGRVTLSSGTGDNTYTGSTTVKNGILAMGSATALGNVNNQLTVNTGGTLDMSNQSLTVGNLTGTGGVITSTHTSGTRTLTIGSGNAGGGNFQGVIENGTTGSTTALTKTGNGTITLSGNNSYTGATNVNAGSLIINGNSSTATGLVSVAAAGTLGGSGTVGGATTINGNLRPGTSPGVLSFSNSLALASTSTTTFEIDGVTRGTDYDGVNVGTTLGLGGALVFDIGAILSSTTFNLFDVTGATSGDFSAVSLTGLYGTQSFTNNLGVWTTTTNAGNEVWTFTQSTGDLNLAVIPEPSAALLGGLGFLALLRRRR
ncbi:autotransporter-associated beta strand repeat-containing protein [Akkermansiaceae bacterium]|nr:autotransporter-associated beta strand repeat-containing protein [Akkermansiaceae bacterium]